MKHLRQRNINLLGEFTSYLLNLGCTDIHIDFKTEENATHINYVSENPNLTEKNIAKLNKLLNMPRREDMEEYYWELNGDEHSYSELILVGMMIDTAEVSYENNILTVNLTRLS